MGWIFSAKVDFDVPYSEKCQKLKKNILRNMKGFLAIWYVVGISRTHYWTNRKGIKWDIQLPLFSRCHSSIISISQRTLDFFPEIQRKDTPIWIFTHLWYALPFTGVLESKRYSYMDFFPEIQRKDTPITEKWEIMCWLIFGMHCRSRVY